MNDGKKTKQQLLEELGRLRSRVAQPGKMDQSLQESEERFRQLAENIGEVFWLVNTEFTQTIYISPAYEKIWGRSCESLYEVPKSFLEAIHPDDRQRVWDALRSKRDWGEFNEEYRIIQPNGSIRWVWDRGFPIRNESGEVYRIAGIAQDITVRKELEEDLRRARAELESRVKDRTIELVHLKQSLQAEMGERQRREEGLRASEERHRQLFEHNPAGIVYSTWDGRILDANESYARILGYTRAELKARNAADLYYNAADRERMLANLRHDGRLANCELCLRRKDGRPAWILANIGLREGDDGTTYLESAVFDITELWRTREALLEERRLFGTLMDNVPHIIYFKDTESRFTRVNQAFANWAGVADPAQVLGKTDFDLFTPEHASEALDDEQRIMQTGQPIVGKEEKETWQDGRETWVSTSKMLLRDREGKIVGTFGISRDITERKVAERALRESEERYRVLAETAPDAIFTIDESGTIVYANHAAEKIFGYATDELHGQPLTLVMPEQWRERCLAGVNRYLDTGERRINWQEHLVPGLHKSGREIPLELSFSESIQEGKRFFTGYIRDITERRQAQETLARERAFLRSLIDSVPELIFSKDPDGVYLACNRAFEAYAGRTAADIIGKTDHDLFPVEVADFYRDKDREMLASGQARRNEEWIDYPDGRRALIEVLKLPFIGPDGKPLGLIGISRDITERKQLEEQLLQAQKMEAIGQLAGGIAHDFNNLLTVILGNVSLLLAEVPDSDPNRILLRDTEQAALRAAELTSQLLGFSRQAILRLEPANLNDVVQQTVGILRRTIDPRIAVQVRSSKGLWAVQADPGRLSQVLMNLCLNARDAMSSGGHLTLETDNIDLEEVEARRHLEARAGEFVRLRVIDTGHGIPPDILPRIFDPFFTTKEPGKGTGLGLAMVFGIIKQHRGWIEVTSDVSRGTCFDIFLPRLCQEAGTHHADPATGPIARGAGETVLIVDDEAIIRNLGGTILQRAGYRVLLAEDGDEAVALFRKKRGRIDLIILDLTMPHLSGQDTLRQLQQIDPGVRVLLSSGYSPEHIVEPGVIGFVSKPYRSQDLAAMVRTALDKADEGKAKSPRK